MKKILNERLLIKKLLILINLFFGINSWSFLATNTYKEFSKGDDSSIIVTAMSGLSVRNAPNLKSKRIGKLPYLSTVKIIHKTDITLSIKDEGKHISGYWVKIAYKNKDAYVFDGFLDTRSNYFRQKNIQQFYVDDVSIPTIFLKKDDAKKVIASKIEKDPFLIPKETEKLKLTGSSNNCFLETVQIAYDNHYPLVLSPDIFWLAITQGFSLHINENFKSLSPKIFKKDKPKAIRCSVNELSEDASQWSELVGLLANETRKYTNEDFYNTYVPEFSTTTPIIKATYQITLLESFKQAFQYIGESGCGIPYVVLKGNTNDWEYLKENVEKLKGYGLDEWLEGLSPVLNECIQSSKGNVNTKFWSEIYKTASEYGGFYISGWIIKFFPYLKTTGENTGVYNQKTGQYQVKEVYIKNPYYKGYDYQMSTLSTDGFPSGVAQIDVLWEDLLRGKETDIEVYAGFLGIQQHKDKSLEPYISYVITEKEASFSETNRTKAYGGSVGYQECVAWSPHIIKSKDLHQTAIYNIKKYKTPENSNRFIREYLSKYQELLGTKVSITVLSNGKLSDITFNGKENSSLAKIATKALSELPKEWFPGLSELRKTLDGDYGSEDEANNLIRVNSVINMQL